MTCATNPSIVEASVVLQHHSYVTYNKGCQCAKTVSDRYVGNTRYINSITLGGGYGRSKRSFARWKEYGTTEHTSLHPYIHNITDIHDIHHIADIHDNVHPPQSLHPPNSHTSQLTSDHMAYMHHKAYIHQKTIHRMAYIYHTAYIYNTAYIYHTAYIHQIAHIHNMA